MVVLLEEVGKRAANTWLTESHSDSEILDHQKYLESKDKIRKRHKRKMSTTITIDQDSLKTDGSGIEFDVKEESIQSDKNGNLIKQTKKHHWRFIDYERLPDWLKDNEYLKSCHRPPTESYWECFKSIFYLHSETGNIWTHLIGCIVFILIASYFLATQNGHIKLYDKLVFLSFFISAILCLGLSSLFHTVCCHSAEVFQFFRKLDYLGISLLIIGSFIPWIYYGFYCEMLPKILYIAMISMFGLIVIAISWCQIFMDYKYRHIRATIFVCMGLSGVIPAVHFALTKGVIKLFTEDRFDLLITMAVLYIFGAVLYATQIPERFFPGKCDIWLQSHQIFHLLVVIAAITHYIGIYEMATNRLQENKVCTNDGFLNAYFS